jgi:hypothetical protein
MNKMERKQDALKYFVEAKFFQDDIEVVGSANIPRLIDEIYDDLSGKTCENCKYFQRANNLEYCYLLDVYDMKYCDKWESEDE